MERHYYVACSLGLEPAVIAELQQLGVQDVVQRRGGAMFRGDLATGYAANLWLRSAIYVQEEIAHFLCRSPEQLYEQVRAIDWRRFMTLGNTLAVDAAVRDSAVTHSKYAALKVKDAIVDQFRDRDGRRPDVDVEAPDLPLKLVIKKDMATLYRNMSGTSLHKRGWRPIQVKSPLNESIAAGLLLLSDWDRRSPLLDPMCGSGTFAIEAACLAADRAPGLSRMFPFELWPDFDQVAWQQIRAEAESRARSELPFEIMGNDWHEGALSIARQAAVAAGVGSIVQFTRAPVGSFVPRTEPKCIVVNPPYGERLGDGADLEQSWSDLGRFLHARSAGTIAYVLSGSPELTPLLGLRASRKVPVMNGPIECRWLRYELGGERRSRPAREPTVDPQA